MTMLDLKTPPTHPLIAASILSADFARLGEECASVLDQGVDLLHLDVMDGHFVPNLTMGPAICRALRDRFPQVYLDVHLMTDRPADWVEPFAEAGANLLTFHAEVCSPMEPAGADPAVLIERIHRHGMQVGMAVNPNTDVSRLADWLPQLDLVLIMSVYPGYAGQAFIPDVLDSVRWASQVVDRHTRIEIDGGIKTHNASQVLDAGVDVMVVASGLFKAEDRAAVIEQLHQAGGPQWAHDHR
jgi:ribulose-phosphate 3-epimerase